MDKTTKAFVVVACTVVIGYGAVQLSRAALTAISALNQPSAHEQAVERNQARLEREHQARLIRAELNCRSEHKGETDESIAQLQKCLKRVKAQGGSQ